MPVITAATISGAFVFGMLLALLGSLKLALAKRLDLGETRIGGLLSALNLALIPMMLLSGILIDRWGVRWVMLLGSMVTALAILSLSLKPTYSRAITAVLLAGLGGAGLSTASIVLMPHAFFFPFQAEQRAASLNLGNVFFALGALITPALVDVLLRSLEFRRTVGLIALICLVPAFVCALPGEFPQLTEHGTFGDLLSNQNLWLASLVFLFYAPLEGSISIWTTTYLTDLGYGERRAAWLLSGFWAMFLLSRLLTAFAQHRRWIHPGWDPILVIVLPSLLAAVVLGNMAGTAQRSRALLGVLVLGFLLGPVFPTLVAMLFDAFPRAQGTAYGVMFAIGSLGSLILAPVIGISARRGTVQSALYIPMMLALVLTALALVFALTPR
jgi:fucose permease